MTESFKNSKHKKFLALCLSLMMVSSAAMGLASCGSENTSSSSSDSSTTETVEKDTAVITNGSFEFNTDSKTKPIITSASGWSRSTNSTTSGSASSSQAASGIVNTSKDAWENLTKSNLDGVKPEELSVSDAKKYWSSMSIYDKVKFIEAYEDADDDNDVEDLDFYNKETDAFNIDADDLPSLEYDAIKTHYTNEDDAADNPNVLMIHNQYTDNRGTAQKYTSSTTVTVKAGTAAEVSVWVKTAELQFNSTSGDAQDVIGNRGAYIGITHTVGGTTLDQFQVKNINTEGVTENNGWVQYTFYLQGSSYADSTFTMVLGLGQGGGTDRFEYVNGYAFFDDVQCKLLTNEEYSVPANTPKATFDAKSDDKIFEADATYKNNYAFELDLRPEKQFDGGTVQLEKAKVDVTKEELNGTVYVSALKAGAPSNYRLYGQLNFDVSKDVTGVYNGFAALGQADSGNAFLKSVYDQDFAGDRLFKDKKTLFMMSADGAAYTAELDQKFAIAAGEKMAVSFFVKTSDLQSFTGAGITLHDGETKYSFDSLDTTTIAEVTIGDKEDIYDGWQQCFFFVENDSDNEKTFTLSFTLGKTTVYGTSKSDYHPGYAAFTNFQTLALSDAEYNCAATGTYAKKVTLVSNETEEETSSSFDTPAVVPSDAIKTGFANPANYKGVVGGSGYVVFGGKDTTVNSSAYAGLINKEYIDAYSNLDWAKALKDKGVTLNDLFGDADQPLLIYNDKEQAYGFIGKTQTVAAESYKAISVRVKVSDGATAYVYLANGESEDKEVLSVGRNVTFWYDDNGNVCLEDPTENTKKSNIAFKLQANGLYLANAQWSEASKYEGYYANLSNYEKDENGNLIVAENGVSYNYNEKWQNAGNDGIAFYYNEADGKYYAYKNGNKYSTPVNDLATVNGADGKSIARYSALAGESLFTKVESGAGWQTVVFYVHAGSEDFNYRLEVWSGDRLGTEKSAAGSYVLVDANNPGTLDEAMFSALLEERETDADTLTDKTIKSAFSFYDSAKFLRYDETIDKNGVGNSYESYVSSAYSEGIAYMQYVNEGTRYETYVDYSLSDVTVAADVEEEDPDTETEEEESISGTNLALLISSLAVAVALLVAIVSVVVRKVFMKKRKTSAPKIKKVKKEKPVKEKKVAAPEQPKDEKDPYND